MAIKGNLDSIATYTRFSTPASGATFGPFAASPSEAVDALVVMNTLTGLTLTGSDGTTITFTTFPPVGTILPVSPTSITFAPAGAIGALYR